MSVQWALIHVMSMHSALILLATTPVLAMLASVEMEKHAVRYQRHSLNSHYIKKLYYNSSDVFFQPVLMAFSSVIKT